MDGLVKKCALLRARLQSVTIVPMGFSIHSLNETLSGTAARGLGVPTDSRLETIKDSIMMAAPFRLKEN